MFVLNGYNMFSVEIIDMSFINILHFKSWLVSLLRTRSMWRSPRENRENNDMLWPKSGGNFSRF